VTLLGEVFYDALEEYQTSDVYTSEAADHHQQQREPPGAGSAAGSLRERLQQLNMSEEQQRAIGCLLEQLHAGAEEDTESDSGEDEQQQDDDGAVYEGDEQQQGDAGDVQGEGWCYVENPEFAVPPEEYEHPSKIPKFMSKTAWYKANGDRPIYPEAALTIMQAVVMLMAWKADYAVTDAAFNAMLGMLSEVFLPKVSIAMSFEN
jgi:hypothetical protein